MCDCATSVVIGILVIVWMTFSQKAFWPHALAAFRSPFHSFMIIAIGTLTILLVGLLVSRVGSATSPAAASDSRQAPKRKPI